MKSETLRQFMLKKYPTKDYLDCPVPKHYWEVIQEYADYYARIQIEKDREVVISSIEIIEECGVAIDKRLKDRSSCGKWCGGCDSIVVTINIDKLKDLPITLD